MKCRSERILTALKAHLLCTAHEKRAQTRQQQAGAHDSALVAHVPATELELAAVDAFFDYNSADAYLGLDAILQLERDYRVTLNWVPFRIREPEFGLCGPDGEPAVADSRPHWQRKHPQLWREAQQYAALRGLTLRGMPVLQDSSMALLGMLWVADHDRDCLHAYHTIVFEHVWGTSSGSVNIADAQVIEDFLLRSGVSHSRVHRFRSFAAESTHSGLIEKIETDAKQSPGAFGVPTMHYHGGSTEESRKPVERLYVKEVALSVLRHRLDANGLARQQNIAPDISFARLASSVPRRPLRLRSVAELKLLPRKTITCYIDLKSPYAYLAIEPTAALARDFHVEIDWLPYTLDIPSYLGSARVGKKDNVPKAGSVKRSLAQWNAVRYAYMDCRRYATRRQPDSITILGTEKIWDSSLAGMAMLWVRRLARAPGISVDERIAMWAAFHKELWPPFWRRELDIEDPKALESVISVAGLDAKGFQEFCVDGSAGRREYEAVQRHAIEERGIFGVPTYCLELEDEDSHDEDRSLLLHTYWGREHLNLLRLRLAEEGYAKAATQDAAAALVHMPHVWIGPRKEGHP